MHPVDVYRQVPGQGVPGRFLPGICVAGLGRYRGCGQRLPEGCRRRTSGDPVSIAITRVRQDEPVTDSTDRTSPDAVAGGSSDRVELRAERNPKGDGRVYEVSFRASDGQGGTCSGAVGVTVPKNTEDVPINSAPPWFHSVGACLTQPTG